MENINKEIIKDELVPSFGYELLRDTLIPELLGKHTSELTYWAGKHLARRFPLNNFEEITTFFYEACWGSITLSSEKKNRKVYRLSGPIVEKRLEMDEDACFKLEAGFLAQQFERQNKVLTEATNEIHKRSSIVELIVQWDSSIPIEIEK
ncbi:YslB family protein [Bacillus spongiae]|uniref:YslB family protein n=1 Tax=Bacillus spongiae TaxID=2683610 RepID=A0ABU8H8J1_9BACI